MAIQTSKGLNQMTLLNKLTIGNVVPCFEDTWEVAGFVCTGDGIQVWGNYVSGSNGMSKKEWTHGFNRTEAEVWKQIEGLPISYEAKKELGETGVYPQHLMAVVGLRHDNWRRSLGLEPNSWIVGAPEALKMPCPFSEALNA